MSLPGASQDHSQFSASSLVTLKAAQGTRISVCLPARDEAATVGPIVEGGPDGIVARQPVTAHPQGYVYDLWLVKRIADQLGS